MSRGSDALFYVDRSGKKQDSKIHEQWLAEGDDARMVQESRDAARKMGLTEAQVELLYGRPHTDAAE